MRLVAWNANYNNRRRSFEETLRLIEPLHADVVVLSETARPERDSPRAVGWTGGLPGLAVAAFNGLELAAHEANDNAPPLAAGYRVRGRVDFDLLAIWPVKGLGGSSYASILRDALDVYGGMLRSENSILAGDLNSSPAVSGQQRSHIRFVEQAEALGLASAYHEQTGEAHGQESTPTYRHGKDKTFHLDYCFVSSALIPAANINILRGGEWASHSDHDPVVLDIPDAAFT